MDAVVMCDGRLGSASLQKQIKLCVCVWRVTNRWTKKDTSKCVYSQTLFHPKHRYTHCTVRETDWHVCVLLISPASAR